MAAVVMTIQAVRQYEKLPKTIKVRILRLAERLERWPNTSGVKALSGRLAGSYRLRTGDYRLQFRLEGQVVLITKIGHRDRFYDERGE